MFPDRRNAPTVVVRDILRTPVGNLTPREFYKSDSYIGKFIMQKRVQETALQENVLPRGEHRTMSVPNDVKHSLMVKKPTIDILDDSNYQRKRKISAEKKNPRKKTEPLPAKQAKVEVQEKEITEDDNLTEYEKMCKRNIEEKMAFLASLNFEEVKEDLIQATSALKPKQPTRIYQKKERLPLSRRRSLRLQRIDPQGLPLSPVESLEQPEEYFQNQKPHRALTFDEVFKLEDNNSEKLVQDLNPLSGEKISLEPLDYVRCESYFSSMKINASLVTKVAPSRIFSVAVHPSTTKTLVCTGSKYGHLSFWNVGSKNMEGGVYVYEPHSSPVNCVAFNAALPCQVVSSSYDGTVRYGNLEAGVFEEVFCAEKDDIICSYFDHITPKSILVGLSTGEVAVVDMRNSGNRSEIRHKAHSSYVKTVSVHPLQNDYFITAGRDGIVSLWDLRNMKKKPIADMVHSRCVSSAYFSPLTGNSILTTSMDNCLSLFDSTVLNTEISLKNKIRHDNHTGRWLTGFRAVWLPSNEDAFVVGSMLKPRRIEIYNTNGSLAHNFQGEDLGSVCSINAFHPSQPILAGGNSSGRMHIFRGEFLPSGH